MAQEVIEKSQPPVSNYLSRVRNSNPLIKIRKRYTVLCAFCRAENQFLEGNRSDCPICGCVHSITLKIEDVIVPEA